MKNLCRSRQEKHGSEREKGVVGGAQIVSLMTTAGGHRKKAVERLMDQEVPGLCGLDRCWHPS